MGRFARMLLLVNLLFSLGCLTEEDQKLVEDALHPAPPPDTPPIDAINPYCYLQRYKQPVGEVTKKVDLLFVIDTSGSLDDERTAIANGIDSFIESFPEDVDIHIAVLLAHGSTSIHSGVLYRRSTEPVVLKSSELSSLQMRDYLRSKMNSSAPEDAATDGGEAGLYSLKKALTQVEQIRSQDFLRTDAALAVVFVADENDICAIYPDGVVPVPDPNNKEIPAFARDCGGVTPESVLTLLREVKGETPLLVGGILYSDVATVPAGGENEVGYGYLEMIDLDVGIAVDLASGDYEAGLAEIGHLVTVKIETLKDFQLTTLGVVASSISVKVDGVVTPHLYTPLTRTVHLEEAGGSLSTVDIYYCTSDQAIF